MAVNRSGFLLVVMFSELFISGFSIYFFFFYVSLGSMEFFVSEGSSIGSVISDDKAM